MAYSCEDTIFEERKALMVSPTAAGRITTFRHAHFIKPTSNSITGPTLKLPSLSHCSESVWPIIVHFNGWHDPLKKWPIWVNNMLEKYKITWEKSGIYEAIKCSTYKIRKHNELIFGLAERWCCETSSFLFPWGEATITLEDLMILGGFSVLGSPFSMAIEANELIIEEGLKESIKSILKSKGRDGGDVSHSEWLDYFMGSGDDLEQEAFLTLWLSRCVVPGNEYNAINKNNFSIAIHLARGIKIALAPVVLATLYRDMSLLKETIDKSLREETIDKSLPEETKVASSKISVSEAKNSKVSLGSPIQYVQVWAWERLPPLQPKPKVILHGQPRLARWHGVNSLKYNNVRLVIDSAGDSFLCRPYAIATENWVVPKYCKDEEQWVYSTGDFSEELESLARCLRVSELVGTHSIEAYLPHRVAMQFGLDQDLPLWIPKSNASPDIAWRNYTRPVGFWKLYVPSRLFVAAVTARYLKWWDNSVADLEGETKVLRRRKRSLRLGPPPGFPRNCYWQKDILKTWERNHFISLTEGNDAKRKCDRRKEIKVGNCSEIQMLDVDVPEKDEVDGQLLPPRFLSFPLGFTSENNGHNSEGNNNNAIPPEPNGESSYQIEAGSVRRSNQKLVKQAELTEKTVEELKKQIRMTKQRTRIEPNGGSSSQPEAGSIRYDKDTSSQNMAEVLVKRTGTTKQVTGTEPAGERSIQNETGRTKYHERSSSRKIETTFVKVISILENALAEIKAAVEDEDSS